MLKYTRNRTNAEWNTAVGKAYITQDARSLEVVLLFLTFSVLVASTKHLLINIRS